MPLHLSSTALGGIAEASQPRAPRAPRVLHGMVSPKRPEPQHDQSLPPRWVGGWARFSWDHRQPTTPKICLYRSRRTFVTQCPQPKCQHNHSHRRDRHETNRTTAPHQQSVHINSEQLLPCKKKTTPWFFPQPKPEKNARQWRINSKNTSAKNTVVTAEMNSQKKAIRNQEICYHFWRDTVHLVAECLSDTEQPNRSMCLTFNWLVCQKSVWLSSS